MDRYEPLETNTGDSTGSAAKRSARERLRTAYIEFRDNVEILAGRIEADVPGLTDHSVKHLDALWDVASTLADGVALESDRGIRLRGCGSPARFSQLPGRFPEWSARPKGAPVG